MNKYEQCHKGWYGPNGKRFKPYYCQEGFYYDSKSDRKLENDRCKDWFGRCEFLKVRQVRVPKLR